MDTTSPHPDYKDRRLHLRLIGILLLLAGIAVGLLAPLEMYCFYLFSEGGRFHYEGFRFGSFMFGNIASQIAGYYLIALVCLLLGCGHLALRRWLRPLAQGLLWSWLVTGAPLSVLAFFILLASKDISPLGAVLALAVLGACYLAVPWLLIRFYRGRNVTRTLEAGGRQPGWLEALPLPVLTLGILELFHLVMLHLLILFNGIFPLFGTFRYGYTGILLLDLAIASLAAITWGTFRRQAWAWAGAVLWLGLFTLSTAWSFLATGYPALLEGLAFPPQELEWLGGIPARGWHLALLAGLPPGLTWGLALSSRKHFTQKAAGTEGT